MTDASGQAQHEKKVVVSNLHKTTLIVHIVGMFSLPTSQRCPSVSDPRPTRRNSVGEPSRAGVYKFTRSLVLAN